MDLSERQETYEKAYDHSIIARIPVVIKLNIRGYQKITRNTKKPYCHRMLKAMSYAAMETIKEIEGAVFGYIFNDEIIFILKNDQGIDTEPWFANKIQAISSVTSSLITYNFQDYIYNNNYIPNLSGPVIFKGLSFAVPNIIEISNYLIYRQNACLINAVNSAIFHELSKNFNKKEVLEIINEKSISDRIEILKNECEIEVDDYPSSFLRGVALYKIPKIIEDQGVQKTKHRWSLDLSIPKFTEDTGFLFNIIMNGFDIFRPERDLPNNEE